MPEKKDGGWTIDDSPLFTKEQLEEIQRLKDEGNTEELDVYLDSILNKKLPKAE